MSVTYDIDSAIARVRHVIQEHAPPHFELGGSARLDDVRWLAKVLGWELPDAYLRTIEIHDGVFAGLDIVLSSDRAFEMLRIFRDDWHRPDGYWPVGADGCGNYWAMNICRQEIFPAGTVLFTITNATQIQVCYPMYLLQTIQRSCRL